MARGAMGWEYGRRLLGVAAAFALTAGAVACDEGSAPGLVGADDGAIDSVLLPPMVADEAAPSTWHELGLAPGQLDATAPVRDVVTHVAVVGDGHDGAFYASHPAQLNLSIVRGSEGSAHMAVIGLIELNEANPLEPMQGADATCMLGSLELPSGAAAGETMAFEQSVVVSEACLGDGTDGRVMVPWVWLVSLDELESFEVLDGSELCDAETGECDLGESADALELTEGEALPNRFDQAALTFFDEAHALDPRNQACVGLDGTRGCSQLLQVSPSPGLDVVVTGTANQSSVAVQEAPVQNPAAEGAAVYERPLFVMDSTVAAYGQATGDIVSDPLTGALVSDGSVELPADTRIVFDVCPTELGLDCAGAAWMPLDVEVESAQGLDYTDGEALERLTALNEQTFKHELFARGATADQLNGPWGGLSAFTVRTCVVSQTLEEKGLDADATVNNCAFDDVLVVEAEGSGPSQVWGGRYDLDAGGWLLGFDFSTGHYDTIDTLGLHTTTWLRSNFQALGFFHLKIVDAFFNADAFVDIINTGLDYQFEAFGNMLSSYHNRITDAGDPIDAGKDAPCSGNSDCSYNFPTCTEYNLDGVGKCKKICSHPDVCVEGQSCVDGECVYDGPSHVGFNRFHAAETTWTKSWCYGFAFWIVVIIVGIDFCAGGGLGHGKEVRIVGAKLCGEDQKQDICHEGQCYIGKKYCDPGQDPADCGTCSVDADCRCNPDLMHKPPMDLTEGDYANLNAPLRRLGVMKGSIYGLASAFVEVTGYASILIAKAGITGHLDLITVQAPKFTGGLYWATQSLGQFASMRVASELSIGVQLTWMSGYITAWAKVLLPYICWKKVSISLPWGGKLTFSIPWLCFEWKEIWKAFLAQWNGWSKYYPIWEQNLFDEQLVISPPGGG